MDLTRFAADPEALATIEAAKITAEATTQQAWVEAAAVIGAVVAGGLAYFGAVRQVRLQERAHEARALAYRFRLGKLVGEHLAQITRAWEAARQQLTAFEGDRGSVRITSFRVAMPQSLHDENWEVHALLGRRAVELILIVEDASRRLAAFDREIGDEALHTDSHFDAAPPTLVEECPDGTAVYAPQAAIIDYVQVLEGLQRALAALQDELAVGSHGRAWRRWRRWARLHGPAATADLVPTDGRS
jgi:hypothetical protein